MNKADTNFKLSHRLFKLLLIIHLLNLQLILILNYPTDFQIIINYSPIKSSADTNFKLSHRFSNYY